MEKELNIAAILKDKPQGTKLYDLLYNVDVELDTISTTDTETVVWCTNETDNNTTCHRGYSEFGTIRGCPDGLQILLPSKEMRDWRKFSWKKGDILAKDSTCVCVFNEWNNDKYTSIKCKYIKYMDAGSYAEDKVYITDDLHLASQEEKDAYISSIEERYGGKLNLETLEIEKQPKFKDGDILYVKTKLGSEYIMINKLSEEVKTAFYVACNLSSKKIYWNQIHSVCRDEEIGILRQVTDYEKSQLFEALAKEGKVWDSEKKQIVDLKPKWITPKPFDRVITRNAYDNIWTANIFSHMDSYGNYVTIGCVGGYPYCLPYNEETAHLLGTTDEWKGGE